jgi:hypothetical protein
VIAEGLWRGPGPVVQDGVRPCLAVTTTVWGLAGDRKAWTWKVWGSRYDGALDSLRRSKAP